MYAKMSLLWRADEALINDRQQRRKFINVENPSGMLNGFNFGLESARPPTKLSTLTEFKNVFRSPHPYNGLGCHDKIQLLSQAEYKALTLKDL